HTKQSFLSPTHQPCREAINDPLGDSWLHRGGECLVCSRREWRPNSWTGEAKGCQSCTSALLLTPLDRGGRILIHTRGTTQLQQKRDVLLEKAVPYLTWRTCSSADQGDILSRQAGRTLLKLLAATGTPEALSCPSTNDYLLLTMEFPSQALRSTSGESSNMAADQATHFTQKQCGSTETTH
ncbi:Hypothetical predicted protein, partial [Pelobates cultripes]